MVTKNKSDFGHILRSSGLAKKSLQRIVKEKRKIEDSIHLAVDTGVSDIIVTGDFNLNMLNPQTFRKISSFCYQFSFHQMIKDPTHFTENSSSLIDLVLVSNENHVIHCGVGDPFLQQELWYHCPIWCLKLF